MKSILLFYQEVNRVFGDIVEEVQKQDILQNQFHPRYQKLSMKETIFTLFPSTKEDASLRIFKDTVTDSQGYKRMQVVVSITDEYQEQLFSISPTLKNLFFQYSKYNKNDFWAHVVCAANKNNVILQKQLGYIAKDDFKDARNLLKELEQQIVYKYSPIQHSLAEMLKETTKHDDLLKSYSEGSIYKRISDNNNNNIENNINSQQYIANGVIFPELAFVSDTQQLPQNHFDGSGIDCSQRFNSDNAFHTIRQINLFSSNLLTPFKNCKFNQKSNNAKANIDIDYLKQHLQLNTIQQQPLNQNQQKQNIAIQVKSISEIIIEEQEKQKTDILIQQQQQPSIIDQPVQKLKLGGSQTTSQRLTDIMDKSKTSITSIKMLQERLSQPKVCNISDTQLTTIRTQQKIISSQVQFRDKLQKPSNKEFKFDIKIEQGNDDNHQTFNIFIEYYGLLQYITQCSWLFLKQNNLLVKNQTTQLKELISKHIKERNYQSDNFLLNQLVQIYQLTNQLESDCNKYHKLKDLLYNTGFSFNNMLRQLRIVLEQAYEKITNKNQ